jgi:hypothetical protein
MIPRAYLFVHFVAFLEVVVISWGNIKGQEGLFLRFCSMTCLYIYYLGLDMKERRNVTGRDALAFASVTKRARYSDISVAYAVHLHHAIFLTGKMATFTVLLRKCVMSDVRVRDASRF